MVKQEKKLSMPPEHKPAAGHKSVAETKINESKYAVGNPLLASVQTHGSLNAAENMRI